MCADSNVILLIEDNPGDQRLVSEPLAEQHLNYQVRIVSDGAAALEAAHTAGTGTDSPIPALCVLDLHLPVVDGCEVLRAFRENPACAEMPIVVLSSCMSPEECRTVSAFEKVYYIQKPASLDEFLLIGPMIRDVLGVSSTVLESGSDAHAG